MMYKKTIWNDNPFDQWGEEELLCMEKGGVCYGKGGGGSPPPAPAVQTQVQQSEFPTELKPFIQDIFGKAQAIQESKEEEGFQAFQGPLQAEFDPAQTRSFQQIEALPGATQPLFDDATRLARSASGPLPTAEEIQAASNPFVRNVIDIQKREAERVSDVQGQKQDAAASQAGAFGGSRAAILEAERQRNLNQQLGDIESQGQLAAFQDAQQRIAQQRGREASGATQLAALGSAIPAQQLKELGALSGVGAARQTQAQRGIDLARQEFEAEEAFPSQTLQEFSSVLRGFPLAPTRSTTSQQFSAAQPLSTQLLGVGTQALGALGASGALKGAFGQAGGQVGRMPVKKYQGGGALNSLINNTEGLDTQPVIGMKRGGSFMEQLLTGGLLSTNKAQDMMKKNPMMTGMLGGAALPKVLGALQQDTSAPQAAAPTLSQEDVDKQVNAILRQRAAQGQQAASAGAPRGQAFSQTGNQVRQPFKHGGGLRQMVNLPSNRVQFGKNAYQDVSYIEEALEENITGPVGEFFTQPFDIGNARARAEFMREEGKIDDARYGSAFNPQRYTDLFAPGEASSYLKARDKRAEDFEASLDKPKQKEEAQTETAKELKDSPKPTKPAGEDLFLSPEEAAYSSLMDSQAGQNAAKRYFAGENVGLANISEALKAYKGFKDTEMTQRRLIDKAQREKSKATAAAMRARLEDQKIMSEIVKNLDARDVATLNAIGKQIDTLTLTVGPDAPEIANLMARQNAIIAKGQSNLARAAELGSVQYGASKPVKERLGKENNLALAQRLAALEAAQKEG